MAELIRILKQESIFPRLRWACLAASTDKPSRPAVTYLHVEKALSGYLQFTGCDGFRLHRFNVASSTHFEDARAPRLYAITKLAKGEIILTISDDDDLVYPDVNSAIPDETGTYKSLNFKYADKGASIHAVYAATIRLMAPDLALDAALFSDMLNADIRGGQAVIKVYRGKLSCVTIEAEGVLGLTMPTKILNEDLIVDSLLD